MIEYKDIKAGETYNMRVKVMAVNAECKEAGFATIPIDANGKVIENQRVYYGLCIASALLPITPQNGTKNTEPSPKYDPCRKFREGDNVSPCFWNNRPPTAYNINEITAHFMPEDGLCIVNKDEFPDSTVLVEYKGEIISMQACHLELVTPVEELEPYFVMELKGAYGVYNTRFQPETEACHFYTDMHPHAKEAAEAECDRLNAEYRKGNA